MLNELLELQKKAAAMETGFKNDPPGTPSGPYGHGPGGLFNVPGTNDQVFSAMLLPVAGALNVIPAFKTDPAEFGEDTGTFGGVDVTSDSIVTGVTAGALDNVANQPTGDCADGPEGGLMKLCTIVNPYSRFRAGTREVSLYRAGRRASRLDPITLRLMNFPAMQGFLGGPNTGVTPANALANEMAKRMVETAVSFTRMIAKRAWIGSPAYNNGEFKDIVGLDIHINAGNKIDRDSSAVCKAADSKVFSFAYDKVNGTGRSLVRYMEMADINARWNATQMGLDPFDGWIFMRPEMWFELTDAWPVAQFQKALVEIAKYTNARLNIDAMSAQTMRQQFRDSMTLPVNGHLYEVVLDNTMPFETPNQVVGLQPGQYASSIVFVPKTVMGGVPATYWTWWDHNNENSMTIQRLTPDMMTFTTDDGLWRWYVNFKNGCLKVNYETSPRLKCRTPMLGWRIDRIVAQPQEMLRDYDPSSDYFADGGNTTGAQATKYYTNWSPTAPVAL